MVSNFQSLDIPPDSSFGCGYTASLDLSRHSSLPLQMRDHDPPAYSFSRAASELLISLSQGPQAMLHKYIISSNHIDDRNNCVTFLQSDEEQMVLALMSLGFSAQNEHFRLSSMFYGFSFLSRCMIRFY